MVNHILGESIHSIWDRHVIYPENIPVAIWTMTEQNMGAVSAALASERCMMIVRRVWFW